MTTSRPCTCGHRFQAHHRRYHYCVACVVDATIPLIRECHYFEASPKPPEGDRMELSEYDDIIKHLVAIAQRQDALDHQQATTNRRLEETMSDIKSFVQQQGTVNMQNTTLVMRIARTLDLIDEKLARLLPPAPGA